MDPRPTERHASQGEPIAGLWNQNQQVQLWNQGRCMTRLPLNQLRIVLLHCPLNRVHQILFIAQRQGAAGEGWLRLMESDPDQRTVQVKTYSPWLDSRGLSAWRTDADDCFVFTLTHFQSLGPPQGRHAPTRGYGEMRGARSRRLRIARRPLLVA